MKVELNSDNDFRLDRTLEFHRIVIAFRSVFHKGSKYYPQVFLNECLCNL